MVFHFGAPRLAIIVYSSAYSTLRVFYCYIKPLYFYVSFFVITGFLLCFGRLNIYIFYRFCNICLSSSSTVGCFCSCLRLFSDAKFAFAASSPCSARFTSAAQSIALILSNGYIIYIEIFVNTFL